MSAIAFLRDLLAAGLDLDAAMTAAEHYERKAAEVVEARKAKDRERKRAPRKSELSTDSAEIAERQEIQEAPAPPSSLPPGPPNPTTPTPPDISTRAKASSLAKPNGFSRFWEAYPNKVGKAAAEKAYAKACVAIGGPDPPSVLLGGLERAKASRQWSEGYIPHPTTWLNQGRWEDEPTEINPRKANERPNHDQQPTHREDRLGRMLAGAMAAAD